MTRLFAARLAFLDAVRKKKIVRTDRRSRQRIANLVEIDNATTEVWLSVIVAMLSYDGLTTPSPEAIAMANATAMRFREDLLAKAGFDNDSIRLDEWCEAFCG